MRDHPECAPTLPAPGIGRIVLAGLGWLSVGLAFAGAVLPGLPTTVFVLAAAWCFSRSFPRFELWLRGHKWFGGPLRRLSGPDGMPRSAKRLALGSMWMAVGLSFLLLVGSHPRAAGLAVGLAVLGTLAILFVVPSASER
jgi:uncharacterized membrane protein YbaN (DUF454 family)